VKVNSSYIYGSLVKVQYMRKTLWPLVWSPSSNEALKGPVFRNYITGFKIHLQVGESQQVSIFNQLQSQYHRG